MNDSLKRRTLGNLALTAGTRVATLVMQLGANIVLARNLGSVDYGIVGYAQVFIAFLTLVSEFGLNSAAIQQRTLSAASLRTGFTLRLCLGLAAFGLALAIAPLCGPLLGEPAVGDVIALLAVGFLINALAFMPSVRLLRELDYRKFVLAQLAGAAVNSTVTLVLAVNGFTYWSIVVANVAATAASVIVLNTLVRTRMELALDRPSVSHYASFGGHLFLAWVLTFILMHLDDFVVGTLSGSAALGFYALAFTWGAKLSETIGSVVNSVLFPTFSKIQGDLPRLRSAYLKSLQLVGFLAIGGYTALALVSADFLFWILGAGTDKWQPALLALQILCLYGVARTLLEVVGSVVMAIGGVPLLVRANLLAAVVEAVLIFPVLRGWGIEGVAVVVGVSYACQYLVFVPALRERLKVRAADLLLTLWQPAAAAAIAAAMVLLARSWELTGSGSTRFWGDATVIAVAYLLAYGALTRGATYRELYNAVMKKAGSA